MTVSAHDALSAPSADETVSRETREAFVEKMLGAVERTRCDRCGGCDRCGKPTRLDKHSAGDIVRRERRLLNVSAHAFAKRVGLSTSYLCDLELGGRPWTPDLLRRVAGVLYDVRAEQAEASR